MSTAAQTQLQGRLSWGGSGNGTGEDLGTETRGEVTAAGMEGPGWCSLHVLPESRIEGRGTTPLRADVPALSLWLPHSPLTRHVVFYSASYSPPPSLLSNGAPLPRL